MTLLATVVLAPLPLENDDFLFLAVLDDLARDLSAAQARSTDLYVVSIAGDENVVDAITMPSTWYCSSSAA